MQFPEYDYDILADYPATRTSWLECLKASRNTFNQLEWYALLLRYDRQYRELREYAIDVEHIRDVLTGGFVYGRMGAH